MTIAIIDYGSGNLHSTLKSFEKMGNEVGRKVILTHNPDELESASHIVLPGVGAFADCMNGLQKSGMLEALEKQVLKNRKPFLGICVGMQLLAERAYEHGEHEGLGWIKGSVNRIDLSDKSLKIPHMGWNDLQIKQQHSLFNGINNGDDVYFVHSYSMTCENENNVLATVDYGREIVAAIVNDNIMGTQFHPEKSQKFGLQIIKNFLEI